MIDSRYVATIKWDLSLGERLQALRGATSRRQLSERTRTLGRLVTHQYIQQLEQPEHQLKRIKASYLTVSLEVVETICAALEIEVTDLFDSAKIILKNPTATP